MVQGGSLTIETGNAYLDGDYSRRNTEVAAGEYVFVAITDTGSGMTGDALEHAFEPFYTTKTRPRNRPRAQPGLWLRQAISRPHRVEQSDRQRHHGEAILSATDRDRASEALEAPLIPETIAKGTETILVVEDDEDVHGYSVNAVRHLGYSVLEAGNAAEALAILDARADISPLFSDVGLPGMNGPELADTARANGRDLKVVFTSGYALTATAKLN